MPSYVTKYPAAYTSTYVKSANETTSGEAYHPLDPDTLMTGTSGNQSWNTYAQTDPQKFNIDFTSSYIFDRIAYQNYHDSGSNTNLGIKNVTVYGTNDSDAFDSLVYTNLDDLVELDTVVFSQHTAVDEEDQEHIDLDTYTTAYQYIVLVCQDTHGGGAFGVRQLEFQVYELAEDEVVATVNAGVGFGCSVTEHHNNLQVNAGVGFGCTAEVAPMTKEVQVNAGVGFGCTAVANTELQAQINAGVGFGCTAAMSTETVMSINAGVGFGCQVLVAPWTSATIKAGVGFGCVATAEVTKTVQINAGVGFGCSVLADNNTTDTPCSLPTYPDNRWC